MIYAVNKRTKAHEVMDPNALYNTAVWEEVHADPDGWIEWQGGECPLPDDAYTDYKMRRDGRISSAHASWLRWDNSEDVGEECPEADIIAYRPILDAKVSHPGTMAGPDKYRADGGEWPAWDGVGMPRAGALACTSGGDCKVVTTDAARGQVCVRWNDGELGVVPIGAVKPRPIRSEEGRITEELERIMYKPAMTREMAARIYEAIRDGRVPGAKLTGGEV